MANQQQVERLKQGFEVWNTWRKENENTKIDLRNACLKGEHIGCVDLSGADLIGAYFSAADLSGGASLRNAKCRLTNFSDADLFGADLSGANLTDANLSNACVAGVIWDRSRMRQRFQGIRGVESCFGNALFRRDALDQDFLDTLEMKWQDDSNWCRPWARRWGGRWGRLKFSAWGALDYGRSIGRVAILISVCIMLFGLLYIIPGMIDYSKSAHTLFTPFFFSIVTFTTLGYGDVTPKNIWGELFCSLEVIIGYINLGLLLAVLAEKLARRS
jgi:hypothetical protein